uniref:WAP domain-containing protein n=1 Tax=Naja naja TaxID=35670 RepID=A0A8C6Y4W2_NAJNA
MTPRRGSCPLLLFSLVGFLMTCVQEPGADGQNTTEVAEKAGICPQAGLERPNGNCTEECQSDARCKGNQKCCRTGCGTSCRIPDEKSGSCPDVSMPIPPLGICRTLCESDSGCPNIQKCCKNGCGFMTCATPVS